MAHLKLEVQQIEDGSAENGQYRLRRKADIHANANEQIWVIDMRAHRYRPEEQYQGEEKKEGDLEKKQLRG